MNSSQEQQLISNRTYDIKLQIGEHSLTSELFGLNIVSSITIPYPTFFIELLLDTSNVILEEIYGQKPMELTIMLHGNDIYPIERINIELIFLDSNYILTPKPQKKETAQNDQTPLTITAVPRKAYKTMNSFTNNIFQGKKIEDVIKDLVESVGSKVVHDSNGKNQDIIDQILVPPSSLYNNLKYLNRTFGIFNGVPAIFCSYDNKVYIKNLTDAITKSQIITIHQLSQDGNNKEIIEGSDSEKTFFTTEILKSSYKGTSVFAALAPTSVHLIRPKDRLTDKIVVKLEEFSKKYGLISKSNEIFFDKNSISDNRVAIYKDHTGYETSDTFINANMSLRIADITELSVGIAKGLKLENLMKIGEAVEIKSMNPDVTDITGKYILKGLELSFYRVSDWESSSKIYLIRTNRNLI